MRVVIFNDKDNFDASLAELQKQLGLSFELDYEKLHDIIFDKLRGVSRWSDDELKLIRSYLYTGEYSKDLLKNQKWFAEKSLRRLERLIEKEESFIAGLGGCELPLDMENVLVEHLVRMKTRLERERNFIRENIECQKENFEIQKKFFDKIFNASFIECKTTPLKQKKGIVYQKGVDAKIAIDMVSLAHSNSYDVALLFSGDSDLIEAVKLVRDYLGKVVVLVSYYDDVKDGVRKISKDMIEACDLFVNLKDFEVGDLRLETGDLGDKGVV